MGTTHYFLLRNKHGERTLTHSVTWLAAAAVSIGLLHTLLGPDHYLPFIAMSRAGRWSRRKTLWVTALCGLGHVAGSMTLGAVGIALGYGALALDTIERFRGDVAAWLLLTAGAVYFVWGVRRAIRHKPHGHWHAHADGTVHEHTHVHTGEHLHVHVHGRPHVAARSPESKEAGENATSGSVTPWLLFIIFLFGPCEPLIPLMMYPGAQGDWVGVGVVCASFAAVTLAAMLVVVGGGITLLDSARSSWLDGFRRWSRYHHPIAGLTLFLCGVLVVLGA